METAARDATWLLMSLETTGWRGLTLRQVIARADAINHDIMSVEAFERGFGLLAAADLIESSDGLRPSTKGRALLKRSGSGSWHEGWPSIESTLSSLPEAESVSSGVSNEVWDELVREYTGRG